jgi:hypothetical protein
MHVHLGTVLAITAATTVTLVGAIELFLALRILT